MTYEEKILQEFAKILPAQDHYSGTHIYKERRMKLSEEEIKTMYYFLKDALAKMITPEQHQKTIDIALAKYKAELIADIKKKLEWEVGQAQLEGKDGVMHRVYNAEHLDKILAELKGKNE